jgi:hypothetical protein
MIGVPRHFGRMDRAQEAGNKTVATRCEKDYPETPIISPVDTLTEPNAA